MTFFENYKRIGVSENNIAYWVGINGLLCSCPRDRITKNFLLQLAPIGYWREIYSNENQKGTDWDLAVSHEINEISNTIINPDNIIGRGAFRYNDNLSYYDGKTITGKENPDHIYIKKEEKKIGIEYFSNETENEIRDKIQSLEIHCRSLTFKAESDVISALGWTIVAPFCGCLKYRPNVMLTGPSGSGKSAIVSLLFSRLTNAVSFSGADTTAAGIRQTVKNDAIPIILEECDIEKEKQQQKDALLMLARLSTSDDTPAIAKGTQTQFGAINYRMRSCFMFVSIDPSIKRTQDENRTYKISLIRASKEQANKYRNHTRHEIKKILTDKFVNQFRSVVWNRLGEIEKHADEIKNIIDNELNTTQRMLDLDSILLAAYFLIFRNRKFGKNDIDVFYKNIGDREIQDTPEEILNGILDSKIRVDNKDTTIRTACGSAMRNDLYKDALNIYGILVGRHTGKDIPNLGNDLVFISDGINETKKISGNYQYHLLLRRHERCIKGNFVKKIGGVSRRCTVFSLSDIWEV
jgi:putative DNA primase/helicase